MLAPSSAHVAPVPQRELAAWRCYSASSEQRSIRVQASTSSASRPWNCLLVLGHISARSSSLHAHTPMRLRTPASVAGRNAAADDKSFFAADAAARSQQALWYPPYQVLLCPSQALTLLIGPGRETAARHRCKDCRHRHDAADITPLEASNPSVPDWQARAQRTQCGLYIAAPGRNRRAVLVHA